LYQLNRSREFSSFLCPVRFMLAQSTMSPPFPLPGAASPLAIVVTPPHHVTLPPHWAKMSLLPPLHLPATLCSIASPLEPKLMHWNRTTTTGYPPRTAKLSPSTAIKRSSQPWPLSPPLNCVSILPPLCWWPNLARLKKPNCPIYQTRVFDFGRFRTWSQKRLNLNLWRSKSVWSMKREGKRSRNQPMC
jgi:hypothetical protein